MPLRSSPEKTLRVTWEAQAAPTPAPDHPDEGGQTLCVPTEGRPEA